VEREPSWAWRSGRSRSPWGRGARRICGEIRGEDTATPSRSLGPHKNQRNWRKRGRKGRAACSGSRQAEGLPSPLLHSQKKKEARRQRKGDNAATLSGQVRKKDHNRRWSRGKGEECETLSVWGVVGDGGLNLADLGQGREKGNKEIKRANRGGLLRGIKQVRGRGGGKPRLYPCVAGEVARECEAWPPKSPGKHTLTPLKETSPKRRQRRKSPLSKGTPDLNPSVSGQGFRLLGLPPDEKTEGGAAEASRTRGEEVFEFKKRGGGSFSLLLLQRGDRGAKKTEEFTRHKTRARKGYEELRAKRGGNKERFAENENTWKKTWRGKKKGRSDSGSTREENTSHEEKKLTCPHRDLQEKAKDVRLWRFRRMAGRGKRV